uniref:Uncharacterized protein n=1 Tax=Arundo donax TaxID=35708 RepID=A0A0A9H890_ARUDO
MPNNTTYTLIFQTKFVNLQNLTICTASLLTSIPPTVRGAQSLFPRL